MGTRTTIATLLTLALLLPCPIPAPAQSEDSGWEPWTGRRPGEHGDGPDDGSFVWSGQVIDRRTGEPIPGCRVRVYSEIGRVVLDGDAILVGEGVTDEDGFVAMGVWREPSPSKWVYEAEGYAPRTVTNFDLPGKSSDAVVGLGVEPDFRGRVFDPLGRPCPGVRVSTYQGCRHAPALRRAVTDAEGRFVLENVEVDQLWIEGSEIASAYGDWVMDENGEAVVFARPGVTATGRVTDRDGKPLANILVRGMWSRGPGVRTSDEGRFVLPGLEAGGEIHLSTDTLPVKDGVVGSTWAADVVRNPRPLHLRFDVKDASVPRSPDTSKVTLDLPGGPGRNRVTLIHRETGQVWFKEYEDGKGTMEVPAGPYEVRVGGPFCSSWLVPFEDELRSSGPLLEPKPYLAVGRVGIRIRLVNPPTDDDLPFGFQLRLQDGQGRCFAELSELLGAEEILVPANVPLALWSLGGPLRPTAWPIGPVPTDSTEPVVVKVDWPTRTRLAFRLPEGEDPDDLRVSLLDATYEHLEQCYADEVSEGNLVVTHQDRNARYLLIEHAMADKTALVALPDNRPPGPVHQLGVVRFEFPRTYRATVRDDQGRPLEGLSVIFLPEDAGQYPGEEVEGQPGGIYTQVRSCPVHMVMITGMGRPPVEQELAGWGPFEVTLSSASVTVELPAGDSAGAWGYLDGLEMHLNPESRTLSMTGVRPGVHRLKIQLPDGTRLKREIVLGKEEKLVLSAP